jgi:hypothetical protein
VRANAFEELSMGKSKATSGIEAHAGKCIYDKETVDVPSIVTRGEAADVLVASKPSRPRLRPVAEKLAAAVIPTPTQAGYDLEESCAVVGVEV